MRGLPQARYIRIKGLYSFVYRVNSQEGFLFLSVKPGDQILLIDVSACKNTTLSSLGSGHIYRDFDFPHHKFVVYTWGGVFCNW